MAGILFDLDDTLLDHRGAARKALSRWAPSAGLTEPLEILATRWERLETTFYQRYQAGELTRLEQRRHRVRCFLPSLPDGNDAADAAFEEYWNIYEESWRLFDDARDALMGAQDSGLAVGILTNGQVEDQQRKVEAVGLVDMDVPLIASSQLPAAKPDPRAFVTACEILGVAPHRCFMVGDSIENDIHGARRAGLSPILLDRYDVHELPGTTRIRSLRELFAAAHDASVGSSTSSRSHDRDEIDPDILR